MRPFLAALALCLLPQAGLAQELPLDRISAYLNGLTRAEADFTQYNADGSVSSGTVYIHRPGRMRFEYNPPNKALVIAGAGEVAVFDPKSNQPPEQYPLAKTPLNLILAPHIDLSTAHMVVGHEAQDGSTVVIAQDPKHPDYGTIRMVFSDNPVALTQWTISDDAGGQTTVKLSALTPAATLPDSLFDIGAATAARLGR